MEQNNYPQTKEFELKYLFIALKKCFVWMLLAAVLLGCVAGVYAYNGKTYTVNLIFRVTNETTSHSLLYYLQSETFAEKLLCDENGLPARDLCDDAAYDEAAALLKSVEELEKRRIELDKEMAVFEINMRVQTTEYERLTNKYLELESLLRAYLSEYSDHIANSEQHQAAIQRYQEQLVALREEKDAYEKDVYNPMVAGRLELAMERDLIKRELTDKTLELMTAMEAAMKNWRQSAAVQTQVAEIMGSVKVEYSKYDSLLADKDEIVAGDQESAAAASKQYISVTITSSDREFAETVSAKLKDVMGGYVESFLKRDAGALNPHCQLTTPYASVQTISADVVVYAAVGAIGGALVVWVGAILREILILIDVISPKEKKPKAGQ